MSIRNTTMDTTLDDRSLERKDKKPLMERKRRARMNESLNDLKSIILQISPQLKSKLEKADILELTVNYFKQLVEIHRGSLSSLKLPANFNQEEETKISKKFVSEPSTAHTHLEMPSVFQTPNTTTSPVSPVSSVSSEYELSILKASLSPDNTPKSIAPPRKRKCNSQSLPENIKININNTEACQSNIPKSFPHQANPLKGPFQFMPPQPYNFPFFNMGPVPVSFMPPHASPSNIPINFLQQQFLLRNNQPLSTLQIPYLQQHSMTQNNPLNTTNCSANSDLWKPYH